MSYKILIGGEDYTKYVTLPLSDQLTLDKSLDYGSLTLKYTNVTEPIKPFTDVVITIDLSEEYIEEMYYFVANDTCQEIIQTGKCNHTLMLIEQTKWLERFIGRTHPITQKLFAQQKAVAKITVEDRPPITKTQEYLTPLVVGKHKFDGYKKFFEKYEISATNNGENIVYKEGQRILRNQNQNEIEVEFTEAGIYTIYYYNDEYYSSSASISLNVVEEKDYPEKKTITSEVNNVLQTILTLWTNETPRFSFNDAAKISDADAL